MGGSLNQSVLEFENPDKKIEPLSVHFWSPNSIQILVGKAFRAGKKISPCPVRNAPGFPLIQARSNSDSPGFQTRAVMNERGGGPASGAKKATG